MGTYLVVAEFDMKRNFTGKIFGPFPTLERATQFQESASMGGQHYVRLVVSSFDKEAIADAIKAAQRR